VLQRTPPRVIGLYRLLRTEGRRRSARSLVVDERLDRETGDGGVHDAVGDAHLGLDHVLAEAVRGEHAAGGGGGARDERVQLLPVILVGDRLVREHQGAGSDETGDAHEFPPSLRLVVLLQLRAVEVDFAEGLAGERDARDRVAHVGEGGGGGGEGFDDHDWEGASEQPAEEVEAQAKEVERALRQGRMLDGKINGKGGSNLPREIADLLKPKVDWREQLREFVNAICANKDASSWRRVNRRFLHMDTYMPSLVGESVGHIVVGVDTSGSIRNEDITRFLSEVQAIANHVHPEKVDLIYWDHAVAGHEEYDAASLMTLVNSTKPRGGGGTDPRCVSTYLKEKKVKPECVIMLTDGYIGDWGNDWDAPTLWAITDNEQAMSPVGKTIHMAA